jgi:hypothetical protein
MLSDCSIRIERLQNGFNVRITDPDIVEANDKRDSKGSGCCPWKDPQVSYAFSTKEEVIEFITKNLDKALPVDEYSSTFDKAAKEVLKDE